MTINNVGCPLVLKYLIMRAYSLYFLYMRYNMIHITDIEIRDIIEHWEVPLIGYFDPNSESIILSESFVLQSSLLDCVELLKHELVHLVLFKQGKPFYDDDEEFKAEVKRMKIKESGTQGTAIRCFLYRKENGEDLRHLIRLTREQEEILGVTFIGIK